MKILKEHTPGIIALEGVDGCGKTTLADALQDRLDNEGIRNRRVAMLAHCPARELLLQNSHWAERERLLLIGLCAMEAARQCRQALEDGCWVILERTELSRTVYQSMTDMLVTECRNLNGIIGDFPHIDFLVFLDISFEAAQENLKKRGTPLDTIERLGAVYHMRVFNNYQTALYGFQELQTHRKLCGTPHTEVIRIDSTADPKMNAATILYGINDHLTT